MWVQEEVEPEVCELMDLSWWFVQDDGRRIVSLNNLLGRISTGACSCEYVCVYVYKDR